MTTSTDVLRHHREQFGDSTIHQVVTKLLEEAGELSGAITRHTEFRDGRSWKMDVRLEIQDVLIVLEVIAARFGSDIESLLVDGRNRFLSRTWDINRDRSGVQV